VVRDHVEDRGQICAALREQNAELRRKLDDMRAERDVYKQAADALARALKVLTIENDELRRRASRTGRLMAPSPLTPVTSDVSQLASRDGPAGVPSRLSPYR
jgi:predicted RNase H-like nuclease (RuvC/YqgF family)